jgi:hypothetical protein
MESGVNASPLFNIRTSRAINEKTSIQTCDYVGKGEDDVLSIPRRDSNALYIKDIIEIISDMDNITYSKFIDLLIKQINKENLILKNDIPIMIIYLHQLKTNPENIKNNFVNTERIRTFDETDFFCLFGFILGNIIFIITWWSLVIIFFITYLITGVWPTYEPKFPCG